MRKLLTFVLLLFTSICAAQTPPYNILNQPAVSNRPYPTAYFNQLLPNAGAGGPQNHLMPNSANVVSTVMTNGTGTLQTGSGFWSTQGLDDQQHRPWYFGQSSDPVYQVSGCTNAGSSVNGQKFHATPGALYSQSDSDEEIVIWDQTTNIQFQFYNFGGQLSLPACSGTLGSPCTYNRPNGYCSAVNYASGSGVNGGNGASTAGLAPMGNIIRLTEIDSVGHINHGLRGLTTCNDTNNGTYPSKTVFPANTASGSPANSCAAAGVSATNRPPNGTLFFLDYTFAQLDCFNPAKPACPLITKLATWQYMQIEAATLYGITIEDTGNGNGIALPAIESEQAYSFYQTHGFPGAQAVADAFTNYMGTSTGAPGGHCAAPSCSVTTRSAPHSLIQWNLAVWAGISNVNGTGVMSHMHAADPCIALGLQGMAGGCATPGGSVTVNPGNLTFAAQNVGTTSPSQTVTLLNSTGSTITMSATSITGANAGDFAQTNTCPASLANTASCVFTVTFTPTASGARTASLTITNTAVGSPQQVPLTGTGGAPAVTYTPSSLAFGVIAVGACSAVQVTTMTSSGSAPLVKGAQSIVGTNPGDFPFGGTGTCSNSQTYNPGQTCTISAKFCPTVGGARSATISVIDNAPGSPQLVPMTGTGGAAAISIMPTSLTFASQQVGTSSAGQGFTVQNTGTTGLTGLALALGGTNSASFTMVQSCPSTLAPGVTCAGTIFFAPVTPGSLTASLSVSSTNAATVSDPLSGTAVNPTLSLSSSSVNFGLVLVGDNTPATIITATNTGVGPVTISSIATAPPFAQTNSCPGTLPAGGLCSISVTATPATTGQVSGTLSVTDSAAGSPHNASLTVTGTAPVASLTPPSIGFGSQPVGSQTSSQNFTLANTGTGPMTFSLALTGTNTGDFVLLPSGCPSPLGPGQSCLIPVAFKPTTSGARSANLQVTDSAPGSPHTSGLTGAGIALAPAVCLNPPSLAFGNQPVSTSSASQPVSVTNCGTANLVVSAITPTGNFTETDNCATIAPQAHCTINGTFSPLSVGNLTGQFSIASNAASSPDIITLSGFGSQTGGTLTPSSLVFASTVVGSSAPTLNLQFQNTGTTSITLQQPTITGANSADFILGNSCSSTQPVTIPPGGLCNYVLGFLPSGTGSRTGTFNQAFTVGSPVTASLSGTGIAATPTAVIVPSLLAFGSVTQGGSSPKQSFQLSNTGTATLNISLIAVTGPNLGDFFLTNHCGLTLAVGALCTGDVLFSPTTTTSESAAVTITDSAATSPQSVALSGTGVAAPAPKAQLSPTSLSFPTTQSGTTSLAMVVTESNVGNANLLVSSVTLAGPNSADFTVSNNCGTVAPGLNCGATVNFVPLTAGVKAASVVFTDSASGSPRSVPLSGTAFAGAPTSIVAVSTINFGNQTVLTTSAPVVFTISNTGTATLTLTIASTVEFNETDTCGGLVTQGSSCSVTVTFSPAVLCGQFDSGGNCVSNVHLGQITITSNAAASPQAVALQGTAIPPPPLPGPIVVTMGGHLVIGGNLAVGVH